MLELLKKIGVPATVAAVIASLVTMVPLLFMIDGRYAKTEDLEKVITKLEQRIETQNYEIAQLSGFQGAMVSFIQPGRILTPALTPQLSLPPLIVAPPPLMSQAQAAPAPRPAPPLEQPNNWRELSEGLERQQNRLK